MFREKYKDEISTITWVIALGTILAVLSPFNSGSLGWPLIWVYWTGLMALGYISSFGGRHLADRIFPNGPNWLIYGFISLAVTIPITLAVISIQMLNGNPFPWSHLHIVFGFVWFISAAITALNVLLENKEKDQVAATIGRALLDKLPHKLRNARFLALESEDHYLRVHTDAGDALILMRLSDAISAVDSLEGARTHRSWWVAKDAVTAASRGDGRAVLTLQNGIEAPVSRTYAPKLRESGWY